MVKRDIIVPSDIAPLIGEYIEYDGAYWEVIDTYYPEMAKLVGDDKFEEILLSPILINHTCITLEESATDFLLGTNNEL